MNEEQTFGTGRILSKLSPKLTKYLSELEEQQEKHIKHYKGDCLLIDSIFESGNLLHADRMDSNDYNFYMQVDSNTKGH